MGCNEKWIKDFDVSKVMQDLEDIDIDALHYYIYVLFVDFSLKYSC